MFGRVLRHSIQYKFIKDISIILFISTIVLTTVIALNERRMLTSSLMTKGQSFASYIAKLSTDPLIMKDTIQLDAIVNEANRDEDILYTVILDVRGDAVTSQYASIDYQSERLTGMLAGLSKDNELPEVLSAINKDETVVRITAPILTGSDQIGTVLIGVSQYNIRKQILNTVFFVIAMNLAVMFILGVVLFISFRRKIFDPIAGLARAADRFARGDLSTPVTIASMGEIQMLVNSFSAMREDLEKTTASILQAKNDWEESFNTINDAITIHDGNFNIIRANRAAEELLHLPLLTIARQKCHESYHGTGCPPAGCPSCQVLKDGKPSVTEVFEPHLGKHIEIKALPRFDKNRKIIGLIHTVRDITERKRAEEENQKLQTQFLQAQKMDSIGRFAGGIAHDLNNILSVVIGYSELAQTLQPGDMRHAEYLETIKGAGEKAAALTRQILAFSRRQVLEMMPLNVDLIIGQMEKMIRRLIGEDIIVHFHPAGFLPNTMADASQLEQVVMNLAVNARDAMPHGGSLTITTEKTALTETLKPGTDAPPPGQYIMLSVSDTGSGMTRELQEKIFEPFFTTKERGKGTGLGLATVYGIVKQHNGYIFVESEPGRGTTFKVYFPAADATDRVKDRKSEPAGLPIGAETVLIVDDDASIRKLVRNVLHQLGYRVHEAGSALEALERSRSLQGALHLLLTDVVMPGRNGRELAELLLLERPSTKVLFMSGYTDEIIARHGILESGAVFLQKPLTRAGLAQKVRQVLDSGDTGIVPKPLLPNGKKLRILIADDDKTSFALARLFVSFTADAVTRAENGRAAVDLFQASTYDLVLMDMFMPVIDGCSAIREMREFERNNGRQETPIIMLTGSSSPEDRQYFLAAGASATIGKPIHRETLLKTIDACFAQRSAPAAIDTGGNGKGTVQVECDEALKDLIPDYLVERRADIASLREALSRREFEKVRILGHSMKGSGSSYGFDEISAIGRSIEHAAKQEQTEPISLLVGRLDEYLKHVEVVY